MPRRGVRAIRTGVLLTVALALTGCAAGVEAGGSAPATSAPSGSSTSAGRSAGAGTSGPAPSAPGSSRPSSGPSSSAPSPPATKAPPQLPRGGRTVFPRYRLVGYAGLPGAPALGRLGIGNLGARVAEIERWGRRYADGRTPLPVLELITTVVQGSPGANGLYNRHISDAVIARFLQAARRNHALLLLNIQPGRAAFLPEVERLRHWLEQPDVGLALDPEWAVGPGQVPMQVFGHTTGTELNQVSAWLSRLVRRHDLPQKVLVYHQLTDSIVRDPQALRPHPGVAVVQSVDGIGDRADKVQTWRRLQKDRPAFVHPGFKLFFDEDRRAGPLMTPRQVLALKPTPEYVLYE